MSSFMLTAFRQNTPAAQAGIRSDPTHCGAEEEKPKWVRHELEKEFLFRTGSGHPAKS
jgi:hypothetical protein